MRSERGEQVDIYKGRVNEPNGDRTIERIVKSSIFNTPSILRVRCIYILRFLGYFRIGRGWCVVKSETRGTSDELRLRQSLSADIGLVILGRDILDVYEPSFDKLAYREIFDREVLGLLVGLFTDGNRDGWLVVAEYNDRLTEIVADLLIETPYPDSVEGSVVQGDIFCFHGGDSSRVL